MNPFRYFPRVYKRLSALGALVIVFCAAGQAAHAESAANDVISRYCKFWRAHSGEESARPLLSEQRTEAASIGRELNEFAKRGDPQAQYVVGLVYQSQARRAKNKEEANAAFGAAADLFAMSAAQGFPLAMFEAYNTHPTYSSEDDELVVNKFLKPAAMHGVYQAAFTLLGQCLSGNSVDNADSTECTAWEVIMRDVRLLYPPSSKDAAALLYHAKASMFPHQSLSEFEAGLKLGTSRAQIVSKNIDDALARFPLLRECSFY